jgi:2,3-bisphosphoglycerate-independent phosphoglycerate mutase
MYSGLAKIVGMKVLPTGRNFDDELDTLERHFDEHDFFFLHYKPADAAGEDGDFDAKVARLEELDARIPRLLDLDADALIVAGDHSTPAVMAAHSWHPVPLAVRSSLTKGEGIEGFSERACADGSLGRIPATSVMMLALAHAGKLVKFGP